MSINFYQQLRYDESQYENIVRLLEPTIPISKSINSYTDLYYQDIISQTFFMIKAIINDGGINERNQINQGAIIITPLSKRIENLLIRRWIYFNNESLYEFPPTRSFIIEMAKEVTRVVIELLLSEEGKRSIMSTIAQLELKNMSKGYIYSNFIEVEYNLPRIREHYSAGRKQAYNISQKLHIILRGLSQNDYPYERNELNKHLTEIKPNDVRFHTMRKRFMSLRQKQYQPTGGWQNLINYLQVKSFHSNTCSFQNEHAKISMNNRKSKITIWTCSNQIETYNKPSYSVDFTALEIAIFQSNSIPDDENEIVNDSNEIILNSLTLSKIDENEENDSKICIKVHSFQDCGLRIRINSEHAKVITSYVAEDLRLKIIHEIKDYFREILSAAKIIFNDYGHLLTQNEIEIQQITESYGTVLLETQTTNRSV